METMLAEMLLIFIVGFGRQGYRNIKNYLNSIKFYILKIISLLKISL
jgi:hypothetical protein